MTPLNTAWMWKQDDGEIWGLTVDTEKQRVECSASNGLTGSDAPAGTASLSRRRRISWRKARATASLHRMS